MAQAITHKGIRYLEYDDDGRFSCVHSFVEEVDYDWFSSCDGRTVLIPEYEELPRVFCGKDSPSLKGCCGRCEHYMQVVFDAPKEGSDE